MPAGRSSNRGRECAFPLGAAVNRNM